MPSVRFSRDKRGYEYVYLMHTSTRRGKPGRAQVLYWYRTPPGVRIGRKPFSDDVQRMLEAQNPGVAFDWPAIISTPMPPPDMTEFWRERRRAAKAARQQSRSQESDDEASDDAGADDVSTDSVAPSLETAESDEPAANAVAAGAGDAPVTAVDDGSAKRRRRRGGRRRRSGSDPSPQSGASTDSSSEQMRAGSDTAPNDIDSEDPSDPHE